MKKILTPSLKKRKELLKVIAKTDSSWRLRMFLTACLFILAVLILLAFIILLFVHPTNMMGIFIFILAGVMMACVPFFIALSIRNTAKYKCAFPYSSYANGTLILDENTLQYIFWQVGPTEPAAYSSSHAVYNDKDKFIYRIDKNNIEELTINDIGICRIVGKGQLVLPEDVKLPKSEINEVSKDFSFALAFDEKDAKESIIEWKGKLDITKQ